MRLPMKTFCSETSGSATNFDAAQTKNVENGQLKVISSAPIEEETFASLMRTCKFTQMGDPVNKLVVGR